MVMMTAPGLCTAVVRVVQSIDCKSTNILGAVFKDVMAWELTVFTLRCYNHRISVQDYDRLTQSSDPANNVHSIQAILVADVNTQAVEIPPVASLIQQHHQQQHNKGNREILISPLIFAENVAPPTTTITKLPESDERLISTPQLTFCLSLLKASFHSPDDNDEILEPVAHKWIQTIFKDEDEQERLKVLATDVIRAYKSDELKDAKTVAE
ncbi:hypothetical protein BGZ65_012362, partial [Modicella reniformis]